MGRESKAKRAKQAEWFKTPEGKAAIEAQRRQAIAKTAVGGAGELSRQAKGRASQKMSGPFIVARLQSTLDDLLVAAEPGAGDAFRKAEMVGISGWSLFKLAHELRETDAVVRAQLNHLAEQINSDDPKQIPDPDSIEAVQEACRLALAGALGNVDAVFAFADGGAYARGEIGVKRMRTDGREDVIGDDGLVQGVPVEEVLPHLKGIAPGEPGRPKLEPVGDAEPVYVTGSSVLPVADGNDPTDADPDSSWFSASPSDAVGGAQ